MKLSTAIEHCIVSGVYNPSEEFMCHALKNEGLAKHVKAVHDMVQTIKPGCRSGYPLSCAVHDQNIFTFDGHTNLEMFRFTKQLYCWWVYDLKRKGL